MDDEYFNPKGFQTIYNPYEDDYFEEEVEKEESYFSKELSELYECKKENESNTNCAYENCSTNEKTNINSLLYCGKPKEDPEAFNDILPNNSGEKNEQDQGEEKNTFISRKRSRSIEEEDNLSSCENIYTNTKCKKSKREDNNDQHKPNPQSQNTTNSKNNYQENKETNTKNDVQASNIKIFTTHRENVSDKQKNQEIQERGKPSKSKYYIKSKKNKPEGMGNAAKKITSSSNNGFHYLIWTYILMNLTDKNIDIHFKKSKDYYIFEVTIKNEKDKFKPTKISIYPPYVTKLIDGHGKNTKRPIDPDNEYDMTEGLVKRYLKLMNEKMINLYLKYSFPRKVAYEKSLGKDLSNDEKRRISHEKYKPQIKYVLHRILASEDNKEKKPMNYLLNLKFGDFEKIYFDYDEKIKKVEELTKNIYGKEQTKLENFKVYEDCKNRFSTDEKRQKKYRDYFIDLIEGKIPKISKNVK